MSTVRDLLVKGVNVAKGFLNVVYKITDAFIDCEDIFEADVRQFLILLYYTYTNHDFQEMLYFISNNLVKRNVTIYITVLNF